MTNTEAAFQAALDLNPRDVVARGALADHLDEIGDERADGYRALAAGGYYPWCDWNDMTGGRPKDWAQWYNADYVANDDGGLNGFHPPSDLPVPWFIQLDARDVGGWVVYTTGRRAAEDDAARAWLKLPQEVKDAILSREPVLDGTYATG